MSGRGLDGRRGLDFVVVGASKSGTTSLYQYLRSHPRLFLPIDKDTPWFAADEWRRRGWPWVVEEYFAGAPDDALWGTVTPRYMEDPLVPARMAAEMPWLALAALLRHPVDRAFSHYRQQVRRGKETRAFAAVIDEQLHPASLERARRGEGDAGARYVADGEYDRILARFDPHFPRQRLLVLFSEELELRPHETLDALCSFLGLEPGFVPPNLERRYHQGGSRERFPRLLPAVRRLAPLRGLWHLLPRARRKAMWTWFFTQGNVVREPAPELAPELRRRLCEHYRPDAARLAARAGRPLPWPDLQP